MIRTENFVYTLRPPTLGSDSIDEFLFDTRRGFCEHSSSAFTLLMRAAGIPARTVTGYQGGERNAVGGYYVRRQSDAHARIEVWVAGRRPCVDSLSHVHTQRRDEAGVGKGRG